MHSHRKSAIPTIYEAIDAMHAELNIQWDIDKLAKKVGLSRTRFIERFKRSVGTTPRKYLTEWRLTKAQYLIEKTSLGLAEISEQVGYQSETSFNRAFKQQYAITPGRFRRMIKNTEEDS